MPVLLDLPNEVLERIVDWTVYSESYIPHRFQVATTLKQVHSRFVASTDAHIFRNIYLHASAATFDGYNFFWDRLTHPAVIMHVRDLSMDVGLCKWPEKPDKVQQEVEQIYEMTLEEWEAYEESPRSPSISSLSDTVPDEATERGVLIEGIFDTIERIQAILDNSTSMSTDPSLVDQPLPAGHFMKLESIWVQDVAFALLLPHLCALAPSLVHVQIDLKGLAYSSDEIASAFDELDRMPDLPPKRLQSLTITHFGHSWFNRFIRSWNVQPNKLSLVSAMESWQGSNEEHQAAIVRLADWTAFETLEVLQKHATAGASTFGQRRAFAGLLIKAWKGRNINLHVQIRKQRPYDPRGDYLQDVEPEMLEIVT